MSELDHGHGTGVHGGSTSALDNFRSPGKRTRTQDLPKGTGGGTSGGTTGGATASHGSGAHTDPYDFDFDDSIEMFGVKLTGNSGGGAFSHIESVLDPSRVALLRGAAGRGPADVLLIFQAHGVIVDDTNRALATSVAEAYIRWVALDEAAHDLAHHAGTDAMGAGQSDKGGGGVPTTFEDLSRAITGWGADVDVERYAEIELDVELPTEVPELYILVGGKLRFARKTDRTLELEATLKTGVKWDIFKLLNITVERVYDAKLTGENLGAAFIDCLKQTVHTIIKAMGVDAQLRDLQRMAEEGVKPSDYVDAFEGLIPVFGKDPSTAGKIAIAKLGGHYVVKAIDAYFDFFEDDTKSGFKVSIGQEVSLNAGDDPFLTGGYSMGVEDEVGDTEGTLFAEAHLKGKLKAGDCSVELSFTGRADNKGGHFTTGFEMEMPWAGAPLVDAAHDLATSELFQAALARIAGGESKPIDGTAVLDLLGHGALNAATSLVMHLAGIEHKIALGFEVTYGTGGWEEVKGTARTITEASVGEDGPVNAKLSTGTQIDVSKEFESAMPKNARALSSTN